MSDVAVLGAGVAGLVTAWRLQQAGHRVTILEAKHRPGGLSHTVRDGDLVVEHDEDGRPVFQTARLARGQFVNLGPGRLPHHHRRILRVCNELGVELEPYIMSSDANWFVDGRGNRYRRRWIENDVRGYLAELVYGMEGGDQDAEDMIRAFGDLDVHGRYHGTPRAGANYKPMDWADLLKAGFWRAQFWQPAAHFWQDTMFHPRAGMDSIWRALMAHVGDRVQLNAEVTAVRTSAKGCSVTWRQSGGRARSGWFDWVASSIPLPILAERVRMSGFSTSYRSAVRTCEFAPAMKVGWQAQRRFWEDEEIYGGISYTADRIGQFWYPSSGHFSQVGTLTGAYCYYDPAVELAGLPVPERIEQARVEGSRIHAEVADRAIVPDENAVTVAWHKVPGQAGGWANWDPAEPSHEEAFKRLLEPDCRFIAIGDQVSDWPGWQEGCVQSAERAVDWITGRAQGGEGREVPYDLDVVEVPDSRWLTTGDHPWSRV